MLTLDAAATVACDVCDGARMTAALAVRSLPDGRREQQETRVPCSRCRGTGRRPAHHDPMAGPLVDVSVPATHGSVRLHSSTGGLEALWIDLRDEAGASLVRDPVTRAPVAAPVRLTPTQARALSDLLRRYADSHTDTPNQEPPT